MFLLVNSHFNINLCFMRSETEPSLTLALVLPSLFIRCLCSGLPKRWTLSGGLMSCRAGSLGLFGGFHWENVAAQVQVGISLRFNELNCLTVHPESREYWNNLLSHRDVFKWLSTSPSCKPTTWATSQLRETHGGALHNKHTWREKHAPAHVLKKEIKKSWKCSSCRQRW